MGIRRARKILPEALKKDLEGLADHFSERITENGVAQIIIRELRKFLIGRPFRGDTEVSRFLSEPTFTCA